MPLRSLASRLLRHRFIHRSERGSTLGSEVRGALFFGILGAAAVAIAHAVTVADMSAASGVQSSLPHELPRPSLTTFGQGLNLDIFPETAVLTALLLIAAMMLFDWMGSVIGVSSEAGFLDRQGRLPQINRVLLVDSAAAAFGGIAPASSVTTFVESAAGVAEGARNRPRAFAPLVDVCQHRRVYAVRQRGLD